MSDLENALKALRPAVALQRDQLMYRAGQQSPSRRGWLWPVTTAAMSAVAAALGLVLIVRPDPAPVERVVFVNVQPQVPPQVPREELQPAPSRLIDLDGEPAPFGAQRQGTELWVLEQQALRWGIESLPSPPMPESAGRPPQTLGSFMNDLTKGDFGKLLDR
jgi:hypothetical protein